MARFAIFDDYDYYDFDGDYKTGLLNASYSEGVFNSKGNTTSNTFVLVGVLNHLRVRQQKTPVCGLWSALLNRSLTLTSS